MSQPQTLSNKTSYHHGALYESLLAAAEEELNEKGVESFSLRSVAKRAGVSHGAPAHHFGDASGLLTQLAARGYQRFLDTQKSFQQEAARDAESQLAASGLGYIYFATQNPALFRLMFASERTNRSDKRLAIAADSAFNKLVADVSLVLGRDAQAHADTMTDVMSAWVIAHGLADLMITDRFERIEFFHALDAKQRDALFSSLILRSIQRSD